MGDPFVRANVGALVGGITAVVLGTGLLLRRDTAAKRYLAMGRWWWGDEGVEARRGPTAVVFGVWGALLALMGGFLAFGILTGVLK
jgi:hypothetical protein